MMRSRELDQVMDVARNIRVPASSPSFSYLKLLSGNTTVGTTEVSLTAGRVVPASLLYMQAALANLGIIEVMFGTAVYGAGLQLDAGRGLIIAVVPDSSSTNRLMAQSGLGSKQDLSRVSVEAQDALRATLPREQDQLVPRIAFNLADVLLIASAAAQSLRYTYALHPFIAA